jgi:hypothetical protein
MPAPQLSVPFITWQPIAHCPLVICDLSQTDPAPQSTSAPQPHLFAAVSHLGVGAVQFASEVHGTHAPWLAPLFTHAGPLGIAVQSVSLAHAWQTFVVVLQIGFVPAQSAFVLQLTHVPLATSHCACGGKHCVVLVAEHCPHDPLG